MALRIIGWIAGAVWATIVSISSATAFDCTPICGNPTCCIARVQVPVCMGDNPSAVTRLRRAASTGNGLQIATECSVASTVNTKAILGINAISPKDRLSCNWGCCSGDVAMRYLSANPQLARTLFGQTARAPLVEAALTSSPEQKQAQRKLAREMSERVCIFCCTF